MADHRAHRPNTLLSATTTAKIVIYLGRKRIQVKTHMCLQSPQNRSWEFLEMLKLNIECRSFNYHSLRKTNS